MRIVPYGPRALLAEYDSLDEVMAIAPTLVATAPADVVDVVPAARTILVTTTGAAEDVAHWLRTAQPGERSSEQRVVTIDVRYDGDDLADVATACGLTVEEVIGVHSGATYTCAFCGFLPGFSYLAGLDPRLQLARRSTPRTAVPAGSVAIAAEFTAVYPSASPGGWHLLGTTAAPMWDETRDPPALVPPGTQVRFRPIR